MSIYQLLHVQLLAFFPALSHTLTAVYQFIYFVISIVNIIFLSDSDEDPLPPKIRYYTHMQQICTSVSFSAHVTVLAMWTYHFFGRGYYIVYCASSFRVLALCNQGQQD